LTDIIKFQGVNKHFGGTKALVDVSFGIRQGEIHALVGENGAGKSTLMNILSGLFLQDSGDIFFRDEIVRISSPHLSRSMGIATVFQELKNCANLTITENIFLGREKTKGVFMDYASMNEYAAKVIDSYGLDIDVKTQMSKMSVAQMQLVEIAKAIDLKADVLILDEPTSALTVNETKKLFDNVRRLQENGVTIIFISHRLEEVFEISDRISVLRNGEYLGTYEKEATTTEEIIKLIAGKELVQEYALQKKEARDYSDTVLSVKNLTYKPLIKDISFDLKKGEILGFYGLQGSGRTELLETVFGTRKKDSGSVCVNGKEEKKPSSRASIRNKVGMMTEDRKLSGIFFNMDVNDNIAVIHDKDIQRGGFINTNLVSKMSKNYIEKLSIKCSGLFQMVANLSGGNQQKVVLARCLSTDPRILLLDEPTRGVDVGAKAEIYELLKSLRDNDNRSLIIVSSELPEIILLCDRVIVMRNGQVIGELSGEEIQEEKILKYAFSEST
jgi:ABC-type sugar transport system ATPase subunit